jgi:hypothetical protein
MSRKHLFFPTKKIHNYHSLYVVRNAWQEVRRGLERDEDKYADAILGFNKLSIVCSGSRKHAHGHVEHAEDLMYGVWSEEDIRLRIASALWTVDKSDNWQIHGQIHVHSRKNLNRIGRKPKVKYSSDYPDLLLFRFKERDRTGSTQEDNAEASAVEIKYFDQNCNRETIKRRAQRDLKKLLWYQKRKRLKPPIDCGYFLCVDETGKAESILQEILEKRKYKKRAIAYGVIIPKWASKGVQYYRQLQKSYGWHDSRLARKAKYIQYYVISKLDKWSIANYKECKFISTTKTYDFCFKIRIKDRTLAYVDLALPEAIECGKTGKFLYVTFTSTKKLQEQLGLKAQYKWDDRGKSKKPFLRELRDNDRWWPTSWITKVRLENLNSRQNLENFGDKIVEKLKPIIRKTCKGYSENR